MEKGREGIAASASQSEPVSNAVEAREAAPVSGSSLRGEMSAITIGRMLGLATVNELSLLDSKVDLLTSKVNQLAVRLEKILGVLQSAPTGADLERIDVQIGAMKSAMVDFIAQVSTEAEKGAQDSKRSDGTDRSDVVNALRPGGKKVTFSSASKEE